MWAVLLLTIVLVVGLFAFPGAAIVVVPLLALALAFVAFADFRRRRAQAASLQHHREQADSSGIEFTDRDRETLSN